VAEGDILAAEFVNQGEVFRGIRYRDPDGNSSYFSPDGRSLRQAFLRAPLEFSRISSNFNPNRRHPILNTLRAHQGVDYAAPNGTPVKTAGEGKIIFRGVKGGYGNTIVVQHGNNISTLYGHLSRFNKQYQNGSRVRQGEVIGYVGQSGLATGPHLHYEYRKNGVHMNPRTVKLPNADPISPSLRADFLRTAAPLLAQLDSTPSRLRKATANNAATDSSGLLVALNPDDLQE
jgi:murein DD-endopeptidase MepM/ murein hydrolase activator NlpD